MWKKWIWIIAIAAPIFAFQNCSKDVESKSFEKRIASDPPNANFSSTPHGVAYVNHTWNYLPKIISAESIADQKRQLIGAPLGVQMNANTGLILWTPAIEDLGTVEFQVSALVNGVTEIQNIKIEVKEPIPLQTDVTEIDATLGGTVTVIEEGHPLNGFSVVFDPGALTESTSITLVEMPGIQQPEGIEFNSLTPNGLSILEEINAPFKLMIPLDGLPELSGNLGYFGYTVTEKPELNESGLIDVSDSMITPIRLSENDAKAIPVYLKKSTFTFNFGTSPFLFGEADGFQVFWFLHNGEDESLATTRTMQLLQGLRDAKEVYQGMNCDTPIVEPFVFVGFTEKWGSHVFRTTEQQQEETGRSSHIMLVKIPNGSGGWDLESSSDYGRHLVAHEYMHAVQNSMIPDRVLDENKGRSTNWWMEATAVHATTFLTNYYLEFYKEWTTDVTRLPISLLERKVSNRAYQMGSMFNFFNQRYGFKVCEFFKNQNSVLARGNAMDAIKSEISSLSGKEFAVPYAEYIFHYNHYRKNRGLPGVEGMNISPEKVVKKLDPFIPIILNLEGGISFEVEVDEEFRRVPLIIRFLNKSGAKFKYNVVDPENLTGTDEMFEPILNEDKFIFSSTGKRVYNFVIDEFKESKAGTDLTPPRADFEAIIFPRVTVVANTLDINGNIQLATIKIQEKPEVNYRTEPYFHPDGTYGGRGIGGVDYDQEKLNAILECPDPTKGKEIVPIVFNNKTRIQDLGTIELDCGEEKITPETGLVKSFTIRGLPFSHDVCPVSGQSLSEAKALGMSCFENYKDVLYLCFLPGSNIRDPAMDDYPGNPSISEVETTFTPYEFSGGLHTVTMNLQSLPCNTGSELQFEISEYWGCSNDGFTPYNYNNRNGCMEWKPGEPGYKEPLTTEDFMCEVFGICQ